MSDEDNKITLATIQERLKNTIEHLQHVHNELKESDKISDEQGKKLSAVEIKLESISKTFTDKIGELPTKSDLDRLAKFQAVFETAVKSTVKTWMFMFILLQVVITAIAAYLTIPQKPLYETRSYENRPPKHERHKPPRRPPLERTKDEHRPN